MDKLARECPALPYMALAFWLAWMFVAFDSFSWLSDVEVDGTYLSSFYITFMCLLGGGLILSVFLQRCLGRDLVEARFLCAGALMAVFGCVVIVMVGPYYLSAYLSIRYSRILFFFANALCGLGFVPLALTCGRMYSRLLPRKLIIYGALSVILAGGLYYMVLGLPTWAPIKGGPSLAGMLFLVVLPLLAMSCAILALYAEPAIKPAENAPLENAPLAFWKLILVVTVFSLATASIRGIVIDANPLVLSFDESRLIVFCRMVAAVLFALWAVSMKRVNFGRVYSGIMVAVVVVVAFVPVIGLFNPFTCALVATVATVFEFILWCILALIVHQRKVSSGFVFGLAYGAYALGAGIGWYLGKTVFVLAPEGFGGVAAYVLIAAAVLCCAFVVFSEKEFDVLFEPKSEGEETIDELLENEDGNAEEEELPEIKKGRFKIAIENLADEAGLSSRECDIFELLAMGYSAEAISEKLSISWNTVRTHTRNVYVKLGVHSKQELMGLVDEAKRAK